MIRPVDLVGRIGYNVVCEQPQGERVTTYNIHIYTAVRVFVPGIEADSMEEAINKTGRAVDLYRLLSIGEYPGLHVEWGEGEVYDSYLVDVVGDEEYEQSRTFDSQGRPTPGGGHPVSVRYVDKGFWEEDFLAVTLPDGEHRVYFETAEQDMAALIKKLAELGRFWIREGK